MRRSADGSVCRVSPVLTWRDRHTVGGLAALGDLPRPATHDEVAVLAGTLTAPPAALGVTHWSSRSTLKSNPGSGADSGDQSSGEGNWSGPARPGYSGEDVPAPRGGGGGGSALGAGRGVVPWAV